MNDFANKLKVVQIHCPYDSWGDPLTRQLYTDMISLKLKGYGAEYPYGVLPVDATDLIASHHLVCLEQADGSYQPLMGYRSVSLSRCRMHNLSFPPLALMEATKNTKHAESIREILKTCERENVDITYDSSWTILPEIRKDEEKTTLLRNIMNAIHVLYHTIDGPKRVIAGGVVRFKMEKLYYHWGYKDLELNGEKLPCIEVPFVLNEKTLFFSLENFSKEAKNIAPEYRKFWESRLVIEGLRNQQKHAA